MPEPAYAYITINPNMCHGAPCINGKRLRVYDVAVAYELQGLTVAEICDEYPNLTLAQAHAALAYFYDHRDEFLAEVAREREEFARYRRQSTDQTA